MRKFICLNHYVIKTFTFLVMFVSWKKLFMVLSKPRAWFDKLFNALCEMGFIMSRIDPSLFCNVSTTFLVCLLVYVDDIIITSGSELDVKFLIDTLHSTFSLKYVGLLHYFLGIEFVDLLNGDMLLA